MMTDVYLNCCHSKSIDCLGHDPGHSRTYNCGHHHSGRGRRHGHRGHGPHRNRSRDRCDHYSCNRLEYGAEAEGIQVQQAPPTKVRICKHNLGAIPHQEDRRSSTGLSACDSSKRSGLSNSQASKFGCHISEKK